MSSATEHSPFKFLDAFGKEDQSIFFGRDAEVNEVYDKSFQSRLLLVYGASGTGKSSIIHCGLANRFAEEDWMPISIRRGGNILRSWYQQVNKWTFNQEPAPEVIDSEVLKGVTTSAFMEHFKPMYFIFDQFEELFIFGDQNEIESFIQSVRAFLDSDLDAHFIFILRGEYLEFLTQFEVQIPHFFDNRVRVEKMTRHKASQCVQGPCDAFGIELDEDFEEKLLSKINPDKSYVELTFLQVFLDRIHQDARARGTEGRPLKFTTDQLDQMGDIGDVLAEFVDEQIFKMDDPKAALGVLKSLVSVEGTKIPKTLEEIRQSCRELGLDLDDQAVELLVRSFVDKRILSDRDDDGRYEFRHDSLAQKIFERISIQERELLEARNFLNLSFKEYEKRGKLLTEEDLQYIGLYERNLALSEELIAFLRASERQTKSHRRRQRRRTVISGVILLLMILSVIGFFQARQQSERARELAEVAQQESEVADQERQRAEANEQSAEENAAAALQSAEEAEAAREEALVQEGLAKASARRAIEEKQKADVARSEAEENAQIAQQQRGIAQAAESRTEQLLMLSLSRELALRSLRTPKAETGLQLALIAAELHRANRGPQWTPELYQAFLSADQNLPDQGLIRVTRGNVTRGEEEQAALIFPAGFAWSNNVLTLQEGSNPWSLEYGSRLTILRESPNGNILAAGYSDGTILLIDGENGEVELRLVGHTAAITDLQFSPSGTELLSASYDRSARRWLLSEETVEPIEVFDQEKWIAHVAWESDQRWSYTNFDGKKVSFPLTATEWYSYFCKSKTNAISEADWKRYVSDELNYNPPCDEN
ncbi:hypothetical protein HZ996_00610 [Cryomorphaceae bacterium]|nr:hypothetical protein HZ996_00610 [Cryomorphaceae bacterium]